MRRLVLLLMALVLIAGGEGMAVTAVFEDFESKDASERWTFYDGREFPGAQGEFRVTKAAAKEGRLGGELTFDFSRGGNYVEASTNLPEGKAASQIWLWIRKAAPNRLTLRCTDSEGQTFQRSFNFAYRGWQEVRLTLDGWQTHWGGKNDGAFRGAPSRIGLIVENDGARTGSICIDDIRLVEEKSDTSIPPTQYDVLSFAPGESWSLIAYGNSGASHWDAPALKYDFRGGAAAVGVHSDIAILGRPSRLVLTVESKDAGATLRLQLAGHFQVFEKTLGTVSGKGQQEFSAELEGMPGWSHHGGDDNGVPQLPLRVVAVYLDRTDGVETGEVRLAGIRAETTMAPEMAVVLEPSSKVVRGQASYACNLRNLRPDAVSGNLVWSVRDWAGRETAAGSEQLTIPAGQSASHAFRAGITGYFSECFFRFAADTRTYGPVSITAVLPVDAAGSPELKPESPFGMGLYLYRAPDNEDGRRDIEAKAALAASAGVKWSREEFQWHRVEPEKGTFDFAFYDHLVDTANSHGISVYGLIAYWSRWTKPYTAEGIEDYARYCKALVSRYKDRIKHWEIWNEPNIFFWTGPKELYPELLKAAHRAIKEADPEALVLGCSTAGIDVPFIEQVIKARAPFDILTIHPYRGALEEAGFMKELRDTAELTKTADGRAKPVWITEMGLPTQLNGGLSERNQATFLARCYLSALASGVDTNISWYDFREDGGNAFYNEHRFGIVRHPDMAPKPAFRALATVCRTLAGQRIKERLDFGGGILAFRFAGDSGETVVIWSPSRDQICGIEVKGRNVRMTDLMGSAVSPVELNGQQALALKANCPVFITGQAVKVRKSGAGLAIETPGAAHAGDTILIGLKGVGALPGLSLSAPEGWEVRRRAGGAFDVAIPPGAPAGVYDTLLAAGVGQSRLALPLSVEVGPAVLDL